MTALALFVGTYALIASRRLAILPIGRPAGALLGAVAMVATGVLTPTEAIAAVDAETIVLLLGMMLLNGFVADVGGFDRLSTVLVARCRTGTSLLGVVGLTAGGLSALLLNDTVCLFLTPVVVSVCRRTGLPIGPYLMAVATCANVGSAATIVGNPQNMLLGSASGLSFLGFVARVGPAAAVGLALNLGLLALAHRRALSVPIEPPTGPREPPDRRAWMVLVVVIGLGTAFVAGLNLAWSALGAAAALIVLDRREPVAIFARVDWTLLVFFAALFVVVAGVETTGALSSAWSMLAPSIDLQRPLGVAAFTGLLVVGANGLSNVPMALVAIPWLAHASDVAWALAAFVLTVAGNLTLVGSMANLIVAEGARDHYTLGFREYLTFGVPSTLVVLAVGVPLILMMDGWG